MKHAFAWLVSAALLAPQTLIAEGTTMTQDQENVLAVIETMTQAFQNKDIDLVMSSYEAQATVMFEPGVPVSDAADLRESFRAMAMLNPVFDYVAGHEVTINDDIAMHIAPWSMTGTTPDGQNIARSGLSVAVLRRQSDGSWKMVLDNPHGGNLLSKSE